MPFLLWDQSLRKARNSLVHRSGFHCPLSVTKPLLEGRQVYLSVKLFRLSNSAEIFMISSQLWKRFLLRSSSIIFGQTSLIFFSSVSALKTFMPSTMTIFSSLNCASCARILSNPTSYAIFPPAICSSSFLSASSSLLSTSSVAYFRSTASTKLSVASGLRAGRMKEAQSLA